MSLEKLSNVQNFDKMILQLGLMAPVIYLSDGPVRSTYTVNGKSIKIPGSNSKEYLRLKQDLIDYNFDLEIEIYKEEIGTKRDILKSRFRLYKPLLFPTNSDIEEYGEELDPYIDFVGPINAKFRDEEGAETETVVRGYAYHQGKRIKPHEFRGILFRVYGVAIGSTFEDLTRTYSESPVLLHQMAIEVYLDRGFQKIVNLDRESLFEGAMVYSHIQNVLNNWLKGEEPKKPEIRESLTPENKGTIEIQREFYEVEKKIFPKSSKSLIYTLRKRAADKRTRKKEAHNPRMEVEDKIRSIYNAKTIQYKLSDFPESSEAHLNEHRELVVTVPRYSGPRKDLWRTLTLAVLTYPPEDKERRNELLKLIFETYQKYEGKE